MDRKVTLGVDVFSTGQVSKICGVASRTVSKWFDSGKLKGYRLPGSQDRRIRRDELVPFMMSHGLPTNKLPGGDAGGGRVLAVGLAEGQSAAIAGLAVHGYAVAVDQAKDEFDAWVRLVAMPPEVVIASGATVHHSRLIDFLWRVRAASSGIHVYLVGLGCEFDAADETARLSEVCDVLVPFPYGPDQVAAAVAGWRTRRKRPGPASARTFKAVAR